MITGESAGAIELFGGGCVLGLGYVRLDGCRCGLRLILGKYRMDGAEDTYMDGSCRTCEAHLDELGHV